MVVTRHPWPYDVELTPSMCMPNRHPTEVARLTQDVRDWLLNQKLLFDQDYGYKMTWSGAYDLGFRDRKMAIMFKLTWS